MTGTLKSSERAFLYEGGLLYKEDVPGPIGWPLLQAVNINRHNNPLIHLIITLKFQKYLSLNTPSELKYGFFPAGCFSTIVFCPFIRLMIYDPMMPRPVRQTDTQAAGLPCHNYRAT